jgi:hypothetical protein
MYSLILLIRAVRVMVGSSLLLQLLTLMFGVRFNGDWRGIGVLSHQPGVKLYFRGVFGVVCVGILCILVTITILRGRMNALEDCGVRIWMVPSDVLYHVYP